MTIKRPVEAVRGQSLFDFDFPVYVNRARETFALQEHSHDFVEMAYVEEGKGFHYIDDQVVPAGKGDLFYIPVGVSHVFRPADAAAKPLIVYNCVFSLELFDRIIDSHSLLLPAEKADALLAIRSRTTWLRTEGPMADEAGRLMLRLHQEYALRRENRGLMIVTYIIQLLLTLVRSLDEENRGTFAGDDSRMEAATRLIRQHVQNPLSLTDISTKIHIGKRQFNRLIKKATGQTYTDYVHSLQIERCCELLRTTGGKIYEIAEKSGFKDMKHFHAIFKRKLGLSPREYRRRAEQAASVKANAMPEQ
ncbi:helix-turn-helix domain-containing protein [Paenibacillus hodogayensis]|uniref:Helix-turn-helix domain-containing protein n=1 Tax=Paenibacillus hodogayensis TaxID=279208 RepID=A0ABV5VVQ0_9BACL